MPILTKAQIAKIKAIYDRHAIQNRLGLTYRQFRKTIFHTIGCDGAIVIPVSGMFICVERDGYSTLDEWNYAFPILRKD